MTREAVEAPADIEVTSGPSPSGPPARPTGGDGPPSWLRFLALGSAAGVLAFGAVGLILAINGWYRPALAFPFGSLLWLAVMALAFPVIRDRGAGRSGPAQSGPVGSGRVARGPHVYAAVGIAAIVAITAWNGAHASQHVLINRDGGSYSNTARWIARDGSLAVRPAVGPFAHDQTIGFDSFAVYHMPDGTLQFQFAHLLPAVMAEAFAIDGNTGMFHAPEILGGIALLAFFVLAWRLFRRPLFALAAMLALAFVIPQVSFSRDSYSEIPSQILLFTALWLLVSPRFLPKWRIAFASGLFLGTLEATRIDAIVFLIGVPVLLLVAWLRTERGQRRRVILPSIIAFVVGLIPGMTLGLVDLTRHSGLYYHDLAHNVKLLALVSLASAVGCGVVLAASSWPPLVDWLRGLPWRVLSSVAGVLVVLAGLFMWLVRPAIEKLHGGAIGLVGGLQALEHQKVDPTRTYYEQSLRWMSWYLGPLTLIVAIVAAGLLTRELLRGHMKRVIGVLVVLVPGSTLYLYKADAVPDHVWVTRRFLVSAFPLLVLLALGLAAVCAGVRSKSGLGTATRIGAVVFAVTAVAYPLYTVIGVQSMSEQRGFFSVVDDACHDMGAHAAVVVVERDVKDLFDDWIPQGIRSWCGADVAITRGPAHAAALVNLAREWNAAGRKLFIVAVSPDVVTNLFPGAPVMATPQVINKKFLQQTLTHRPDAYAPQEFSMVVARVPTG